MSFQRFVLTDFDEQYAPPEKPVLDLTVIDGIAYLRIGKQTEDSKTTRVVEEAQIAVHVDDLRDALGVAYRGDARAMARPRTQASASKENRT